MNMLKLRFFAKSFAGIFFFILILFISAGRMTYDQGWIYSALSFLGLLLNFITIKDNPELMKERSKPEKDAKKWDKQILGFSALITLVAVVVAGLDSGRFQWSPRFRWYYILLGSILMLTGQILFLLAKNQNTFFSSVARIQTERGHTVCDSGLYRSIRHPGYLGMIVSWTGFPLIMGSLYSIIPSIAAIVLLLIRTQLEDHMLVNELPGYVQYVQKTRYRLVPKVW